MSNYSAGAYRSHGMMPHDLPYPQRDSSLQFSKRAPNTFVFETRESHSRASPLQISIPPDAAQVPASPDSIYVVPTAEHAPSACAPVLCPQRDPSVTLGDDISSLDLNDDISLPDLNDDGLQMQNNVCLIPTVINMLQAYRFESSVTWERNEAKIQHLQEQNDRLSNKLARRSSIEEQNRAKLFVSLERNSQLTRIVKMLEVRLREAEHECAYLEDKLVAVVNIAENPSGKRKRAMYDKEVLPDPKRRREH